MIAHKAVSATNTAVRHCGSQSNTTTAGTIPKLVLTTIANRALFGWAMQIAIAPNSAAAIKTHPMT